jgi:hypothetical protein
LRPWGARVRRISPGSSMGGSVIGGSVVFLLSLADRFNLFGYVASCFRRPRRTGRLSLISSSLMSIWLMSIVRPSLSIS